MKNIIKLSFFALALLTCSLAAKAQGPTTVSLPKVTSSQVNITWQNPSNCTATQQCTLQPFRFSGSCPSDLANSTGWTPLAVTAAQATAATDTSVVAGQTYSYVVEATFVAGGSPSGPGNCSTATIPNVPGVPTGLTTTVVNATN